MSGRDPGRSSADPSSRLLGMDASFPGDGIRIPVPARLRRNVDDSFLDRKPASSSKLDLRTVRGRPTIAATGAFRTAALPACAVPPIACQFRPLASVGHLYAISSDVRRTFSAATIPHQRTDRIPPSVSFNQCCRQHAVMTPCCLSYEGRLMPSRVTARKPLRPYASNGVGLSFEGGRGLECPPAGCPCDGLKTLRGRLPPSTRALQAVAG